MANNAKGIRGEVAAVLPALVAKTRCEDWALMKPPLHCRDCTIHFLKSDSFKFPGVVIKIFKDEIAEQKKGRRARKLMLTTRHFNKASTREFKVPKPVFLSKEHRALGMEFIDAPMSSSLLKKAFFDRSATEEIIRKSARWLKWYHSNARPALEPFRSVRYTRKMAKTVERIERMNPEAIRGNATLRHYIAAADEVATALDGTLVEHAGVHGDFTPYNLFICGDQVIGFDFQGAGRFPISHDICRYLLYLSFTRMLPVSGAELSRYGCRQEHFSLFMDAYGANADLMGDPSWRAFHFMEIVRRMTSLTVMQERGRKRPFGFIQMASLRRSAKHILTSLR